MTSRTAVALRQAGLGQRLGEEETLSLAQCADTVALMALAARLRDEGHGDLVTFSRKVFVPLTKLCRDSCHYCTFAHPPKRGEAIYLTRDEVLDIARAGAKAGCNEVLFTLGDKPELRYRQAAEELEALGHKTTLSYLAEVSDLVLKETGLLPHLNPGVMQIEDLKRLRDVSISQGMMLETASARLSERGGPHFGSPDKDPAARLATLEAAGLAKVPFTTGLLIGIGETRQERVEALLAIRASNERHGHIQEVIIQNFRAKPGTRMANAPEPSFEDHLWTIAIARLILGRSMSIQAPPNLSAGALEQVIAAGINDWGGVSPVTPDHVNPEAAWPEIDVLAEATHRAGKILADRLPIYPDYLREQGIWLAEPTRRHALARADASGLARASRWTPGASMPIDGIPRQRKSSPRAAGLGRILDKALSGNDLAEGEIEQLFSARDDAFWQVCSAADGLRRRVNGDTVSYVVNRNINYTNVCSYRCQFCAFSKGKLSENLRGEPYLLELEEITRRTREAWARGASEVCLQGGIHPDYTGETYVSILRAIRTAVPSMHVHAFSPLEVWQGAATLRQPLRAYLERLREEGLGTLPGTAAEILDDEVRDIICPDKLTTQQWLQVMETAHAIGLRSTATIMFGHVDTPRHWARHLLRIRELQKRTGGFTEFVPLPFVPMEAPIFLKGRSRRGPTTREAILMHAVARLSLHPLIPNIQVSWVKMGREGVLRCLSAGVNDLGGTLMNETISKAAGASHGQELPPLEMEALIRSAGRIPRQRTTKYADAPADLRQASFAALPLEPLAQNTLRAAPRRVRQGALGG